MSLIINYKNIEKYRNGTYSEITNIIWDSLRLDNDILKNFPNLTLFSSTSNAIIGDLNALPSSLTILWCSYDHIKDINPLFRLTLLIEIKCSGNQIEDIDALQYCALLTNLNCCNNQILDLSPLSKCILLTNLVCSGNQISDLSPLSNCTSLTYLDCSYNKITNLEPLKYCKFLNKLICNNNNKFIEHFSLNSLKYCNLLTYLDCSKNAITDLTPLSYCTSLTYLDVGYNRITSLEPLVYLRKLKVLHYYNNILNPPSIQIKRFVRRIDRNRRNYNTINAMTIYSDTQNIHDVKVQQSVMDSVRNLMRDKEVKFDLDSVLTSELKASTKSRILEYFEDNDVHVILLITYKELFTYVWNRITNNKNKLELLKILDDNIQDSECKCFTGRFNRTLSTLVGFYDDIEINISDNSRISAIILQVKDSIIPYDPDKHKTLAQNALSEAGYDSEIVELWIQAIE